jgi:hypothetical protein
METGLPERLKAQCEYRQPVLNDAPVGNPPFMSEIPVIRGFSEYLLVLIRGFGKLIPAL